MVGNPRRDREGTETVEPSRQIRTSRSEPRPSIEEAFAVLMLHKWSILVITLMTATLALLVSSRQTPIYESQAKILVLPVAVGAGSIAPQTPTSPPRRSLSPRRAWPERSWPRTSASKALLGLSSVPPA